MSGKFCTSWRCGMVMFLPCFSCTGKMERFVSPCRRWRRFGTGSKGVWRCWGTITRGWWIRRITRWLLLYKLFWVFVDGQFMVDWYDAGLVEWRFVQLHARSVATKRANRRALISLGGVPDQDQQCHIHINEKWNLLSRAVALSKMYNRSSWRRFVRGT